MVRRSDGPPYATAIRTIAIFPQKRKMRSGKKIGPRAPAIFTTVPPHHRWRGSGNADSADRELLRDLADARIAAVISGCEAARTRPVDLP